MGPEQVRGEVRWYRQKHEHGEAEANEAEKGHGWWNRRSAGKNEGGQANRPRPHVNRMEARKS